MEKLPKIGIPLIIILVIGLIALVKSAVTVDSGEAGVLYKVFDNGVVIDEPPLGEGCCAFCSGKIYTRTIVF